ncbi:response regulator transcription factor [Pseudalkalibacillus caeni]|uniref:Response regulator transcription factor n=1 Tax=Exobacillus caeni TaxID=2574798 RepID=A0A5R9FAW0_9BACL|nr:response regulator transcription factor [Pseudalkalibacillus caeni]TLS38013.1 response regulator transcription factor [Pseudalkalibacillus caeni]
MYTKGKSILIIDSCTKSRSEIKQALETEGFEVWEAEGEQEGRDIFSKYDPCFIILELTLFDGNGEDICRWVRQDLKNEVPMIIVSERNREEDRINGLRIGADDYVTKPFSPLEVVARVETVLRRTSHRCNKITYRGVTLKPLKGEVKVNGKVIDLTRHEFKLLYFLMRHPNQILSREQMLEALYTEQQKFVSERTIDVHIKSLREKIPIEEPSPLIETVRSMGYRFLAY